MCTPEKSPPDKSTTTRSQLATYLPWSRAANNETVFSVMTRLLREVPTQDAPFSDEDVLHVPRSLWVRSWFRRVHPDGVANTRHRGPNLSRTFTAPQQTAVGSLSNPASAHHQRRFPHLLGTK